MNKFAVLIVAGLFSVSAHAELKTGLTAFVSPGEPIVFMSDARASEGQVVVGPWFEFQEFFNSDVAAKITDLEYTITSAEGFIQSGQITFNPQISIVPGVTAHTAVLAFGGLPRSKSLRYTVVIRALGAYLQGEDPEKELKLAKTFETQ